MKIIAGVDEVGRGSLIGPVFAAAVILDQSLDLKVLKDSTSIKKNSIWAIGKASKEEIEKINILQASLLAMKRAIKKLKKKPSHILVDGNRLPKLKNYKMKAVVKGDKKIPSISAASILAKVSMVLGNLNQAGVDLIESIDIAKSVTTNTIVIEALENIKKGVFSGETLTDLFKKEKVFPSTFSQLISVGEQTGSLDDMFGSVATYYEEEFDVAVGNLSSLIEPIMIVFMGITIGGLMLAMYAPIFNVGAIIN